MTSRAPAPSTEGPARGFSASGSRTVRDLRRGESAVLAMPDLDATARLRLAELGVREGETVRLLQRSIGGARVLVVHESRLAVDAATATRLRLQP